MNQDAFIPTRRSLLTRLKRWDDHEGWNRFFDTYWKLLYTVAVKSGLSDAQAQDVVQETIVTVSKKMPEFRYDPAIGSFKSWLLVIVRRRIVDHLRKHYRRVPTAEPRASNGTETAAIERVADPGLPALDELWDVEWEKALLDAATGRVKRLVKPKQWQIFDLYVLKGWPVSKVTGTLGVNIGQVYLAKHRVSRLVRKEIEAMRNSLL